MNVFVADKLETSGLEGLRALGCAVVSDPSVTPELVGEACATTQAHVLIVRAKRVSGAAIAAAPGLRAIIRAGAGYDNIDVYAAKAAGVAVCNCPGMNAVAVAELTLALLLCCDRRVPEQTAQARAGRWNKKEYAKARGLKGRTLGIVGMGAIGREVAARARAFEMRVAAWSRSLSPADAERLGVRFGGNDRASLLRLASECDAVTIHVAGGADTKRLCGEDFFAAMRPGAYFINTSRGSVVDEAALLRAASEKGVRYALDVYADQPTTPEALWTCGLCAGAAAATHHCGASTEEAQEAVASEVVRLVRVFLESERWENRVDGSV